MKNGVQIAVRLPSELLERVDAAARAAAERSGGIHVSRAAAVRMLVERGLESVSNSVRER